MYVVSFNGKGEYRSESKIDEQEIQVQQFAVLGGGQYVLRGQATHSLKPRMAILSGGSGLVNVETWPSTIGEPLDAAMAPREFTQMVSGGDGRVYVSVPDTERGKSVVYSVGAAGELEEAFELRRMPRQARLVGLLASGDRLAAAYLDGTGGQRNGNQRSWIDAYDATSGDLLSTYGPASPALLCYVHTGSEDRFVFLEDGKLVTMAP